MKRSLTAVIATGSIAVVAGFLVVGRSPEPPGAVVVNRTVPTSTSTTTTSIAVAASTSASTTTTIVDRAGVVVVVANATDQRGVAAAMVDRLRVYEYLQVTAIDAVDEVDRTVVYFAAGFRAAAQRLALDAGLAEAAVAPIDQAPELEDDVLTQLLMIVGTESL